MIKRLFSSSARSSYFITTPIFYVNAKPHIGHVYSALIADVQSRWQKIEQSKENILFLTGTDEHGLKIQDSAALLNQDPLSFCDNVSQQFKHVFDRYGLQYNDFIRTTEDRHKKSVNKLWNQFEKSGYIYMGKHESWYSISDETFLTPNQVEDKVNEKGEKIKISKESGHPVIFISEDNYKFKLSLFQDQLLEWIDKNPDVIYPQNRVNEVRNFITSGLKDLSVSRPKERLQWGIPVPSNDSHIIYVWLDALTNYLTAAGYENDQEKFANHWPADCHIIGKDILKFHTIYWPAFLLAANLPLPKKIVIHSHWTVDKVKMSKSLDNVIDPNDLIEKYGQDATRFFLLYEGGFSDDCDFSYQRLHECINSTLADTLGNLCSRSLTLMLLPSNESIVPTYYEENLNDDDILFISKINAIPEIAKQGYNQFNYSFCLKSIFNVLYAANQYITLNQPWTLKPKFSKTGELVRPGDMKRLSTVMYIILESLRVTAILLQPVMPDASDRILTHMNVDKSNRFLKDAKFGLRKGGDKLGNIEDKFICFSKIR